MGTYSEVVVAFKNKLIKKMPKYVATILNEEGCECHEHKDGKLYHWSSVKWYESDVGLIKMYKWLEKQNAEDYLITVANIDYPSNDNSGADVGEWDDNPWNVYRNVVASVEFDSKNEE